MLRNLWEFIHVEKNQKALRLIGSAVVTVAGAVWTIWLYQHPKPESPKSAPTLAIISVPVQARHTSAETTISGPSAVSGNGGVSVNASGNSHVTINHKKGVK
jgi:hypothetical protein